MDEMERAYFAAAIQDLGEDIEADQTGTKQLNRADFIRLTDHEISKVIKDNKYDFPTRISAAHMFVERMEAAGEDKLTIAGLKMMLGFLDLKLL